MHEPPSRWPLAARDRELEGFSAAWARRRSEGLVIFGSAGVGKSRLAEECLARAVRNGYRGGRATASAAAAVVPLGAIAHLIPRGVDLSDPVEGFRAVARALAGPDRQRWALLVDDLHLLDATSAVLLRQLLDARVVRLIGTVRTERPGEPVGGEAVQVLTGAEAMHRIDLAAFDQHQMAGVLEAALGGPVDRRTLYGLHHASGGNVLYLRELVLGALADHTLTTDGEVWSMAEGALKGTPRLTELISTRLAAAGPAGRPVLELLALCEPLSVADVELKAPPEVLIGLEEAGLIRSVHDGRRTGVTLVHPLYAEVLRSTIPTLRRREVLLRRAARIESFGVRRRGDALRVASWRLAATGTADPGLLFRAAAFARLAHDDRQVVALLQAIPEDARPFVGRLIIGESQLILGRWDDAEATFAEAYARAADEGERLSVTLGRTSNLVWSNADVSEALAANDTAAAEASTPAARHMLRINEGFVRIGAGQPREGLALLEEMEEDFTKAPDVNAWLRGALMKPVGLALVGRTGEAVKLAERAYVAHLEADEHAVVAHPAVEKIALAFALGEAGRLADASATGEQANAELGDANPVVQVWMALVIGRVEWMAGHVAAARRWHAEAAALARSLGFIKTLRLALSHIAACAAVVGDADAAEAALAERHDSPPVTPAVFSTGEELLGEAWLLASRGHLATARAALMEGAAAARTTGHLACEALLLTDAARMGGAADVVGRLSELAGVSDSSLVRAREHLAAALAADDPDELEAVAGECARLGADLLEAEAATAAAAAWARKSRSRAAAAATQRAAAAAARCQGARTPLLTAAAAVPLTDREREVALLAAAGRTSKDIATDLSLSVRTVNNHIQSAYRKLGVSTRQQLAAVLGARADSQPR
ncbi:LuxR family transcriptional regulator [Streptomyces sp. NPDC047108]|uniref:LuxR family transcriptional regulator n=1 Tax=Streptomyces sp. NPDC047108 TaxID=3155025 RepID=UPI0033ED6167